LQRHALKRNTRKTNPWKPGDLPNDRQVTNIQLVIFFHNALYLQVSVLICASVRLKSPFETFFKTIFVKNVDSIREFLTEPTLMGKERFVYNTQTLRYEKVEVTLRERIIQFIGFLCAAIVTGVIFTLVVWNYFPSPKETTQRVENERLKEQILKVNQELNAMSKVLANVQERDANVHRLMFGMDPIDQDIWNGGVGGHEKYADISSFSATGDLLANTMERMDRLKRQLKIQSESLDTVTNLARDREKMLASIPSIKPVRSDKLARNIKLLSGFGYRIHPIHKVRKLHTGVDFTAPRGTPIQATGDGTVERVERKRSGYGYNVVINHGYGYQTLYAHMSRIDVKRGETVKKGQQIGLIGSTGTSTAPHCHYEVIYKGSKVNPIHYCMDGLTPEEYQELVEMASIANQSMD
jgi:murein DD-endopeptidase MepM/ murein hydrolase activator NlpD